MWVEKESCSKTEGHCHPPTANRKTVRDKVIRSVNVMAALYHACLALNNKEQQDFLLL